MVADSPRPREVAQSLDAYRDLLSVFVRGGMSPGEFAAIFLRLYLDDPTEWSSESFQLLDGFFGYLEDYTDEPALRDDGDTTVEELSEQASDLLITLRKRTQTGPRVHVPVDGHSDRPHSSADREASSERHSSQR